MMLNMDMNMMRMLRVQRVPFLLLELFNWIDIKKNDFLMEILGVTKSEGRLASH